MAEIYKPKTYLQIFDALKRYLIGESSQLNNFNTGSRLSVLLKAFSLIESQTHGDFFQGLKKAIPTSVYNAFGFERKSGIKATGTIEFTRSTPATQNYSIPIGTGILLNGIKFETISSGNILIGNTSSGDINSQASEYGPDGNIFSGAIDTLSGNGSFVNQPNGVEGAKNNIAFSNGADKESDEDRINRFRTYINSLARSPINGIKTGVLSIDGIVSVSILENYPIAGTLTIYADDGTGILSPSKKTEIEKVINGDPLDSENFYGYRAAGIKIQVLAPTVKTITINIDIKILDSSISDPTDLKNLAKTAIENYVNTLRLGQDVIRSEIITVVKASHGDIYDVIFVTPTGNITIQNGEVPRTASGTVIVTHSFTTI